MSVNLLNSYTVYGDVNENGQQALEQTWKALNVEGIHDDVIRATTKANGYNMQSLDDVDYSELGEHVSLIASQEDLAEFLADYGDDSKLSADELDRIAGDLGGYPVAIVSADRLDSVLQDHEEN